MDIQSNMFNFKSESTGYSIGYAVMKSKNVLISELQHSALGGGSMDQIVRTKISPFDILALMSCIQNWKRLVH